MGDELDYGMPAEVSGRPDPSEYNAYYEAYVRLVEGDDIVAALERQVHESIAVLNGISEERSALPGLSGTWTLRETLGHLIDTERVFAYRALGFARNDATELPGYEPDDYAAASPYRNVNWRDIVGEFEAVRHANLFLFRPLDRQAWIRRGMAGGSETSVRALAYNIAGHELHHMRRLA